VPTWLILEVLGAHLMGRGKVALLLFWGRYPYGWFDRRAISPFIVAPRDEIERALDQLVEGGIIRRSAEGGQPCYGLTDDPQIRAAVVALASLTPNEVRYLAHRQARAFEMAFYGWRATPRRAD